MRVPAVVGPPGGPLPLALAAEARPGKLAAAAEPGEVAVSLRVVVA